MLHGRRFLRLPYARLGVRVVGDQAKRQQQDTARSPIVIEHQADKHAAAASSFDFTDDTSIITFPSK